MTVVLCIYGRQEQSRSVVPRTVDGPDSVVLTYSRGACDSSYDGGRSATLLNRAFRSSACLISSKVGLESDSVTVLKRLVVRAGTLK